ncbi:osmoprotectant transport system substrate-binding protein [Amycolatopsis bartoniae]|uniref:Glycine/betaine ABC transporter substrate-binding protein n=1 Tax=Amycolatopsis bartoniae TaxID=941986 RepID=A0A8H9MB78_9PSEU|nr:ABC transporter substrate-binding protein [Amycolatopsis bartoniae]MBB2940103.1 osmoprotectant transport system substrate-binding protein [Amycolatopsis bartoniae]TVT07715.1 ABC transporter substrate-binding protein [Amycolatopsis bartoniae]GHF53981.1 glycine/betaine ABC transporter substrate-binding protein [Amycolatopsis bartoniae]
MGWSRNIRAAALVAVAAAGLAACGGGGDQSAAPGKGGAPVVVASFNFTDSQILAELYAGALEAKGYPVTRKLNLGSRELIYPSLKSGELQFVPEYQGAAITTGFGQEAVKDAEGEHAQLAKLFEPEGVGLLNYAPAEDKDVYLVKADLAKSKGLATISDLKKLDKVVLAGGPECQTRLPCFRGFQEVYHLTNATFQTVQEIGPRVQELDSGAATVIPVDSVSPVVGDPKYVVLKDDLGIEPTENVVPAVSRKVLDERGADFANVVNAVSAKLTTDELRALNSRVDSDGEAAADVAKDWLSQQGLA